MNDKWFVLVNPTAGRGLAIRRWPAIEHALTHSGLTFEFCITKDEAHAAQEINDAWTQGFRRFISVGGDGTHHVLINGLYPQLLGDANCTIAVIPVGTGNDWARTHKINHDIQTAVQHIAAGRTIHHSVGHVSFVDNAGPDRYFVNVLGMCLDGQVVQRVSSTTRNSLGALAYLYHGVRELFSYRPPHLRIESEKSNLTGSMFTVHIGICRYSGGGLSFTPHADPTGSTLAITCIRKSSRLSLICNIYRLYLGTIAGYRRVVTLNTPSVIITSPEGAEIPLEADGEFLGYGAIQVRTLPGAFNLIVSEP